MIRECHLPLSEVRLMSVYWKRLCLGYKERRVEEDRPMQGIVYETPPPPKKTQFKPLLIDKEPDESGWVNLGRR